MFEDTQITEMQQHYREMAARAREAYNAMRDPELVGKSFEDLLALTLHTDRDIALSAAGEIIDRVMDVGFGPETQDLGGCSRERAAELAKAAIKRHSNQPNS
jgi:hypothetical protein